MAGDKRTRKQLESLTGVLPAGMSADFYVQGKGRGVALTDAGVAVVKLGAWNAKPKKLLALVPTHDLPHEPTGRTLALADSTVKLKKKDVWRLLEAAGRPVPPVPQARRAQDHGPVAETALAPALDAAPVSAGQRVFPAPAGWYPVDGDESTQAYWDGATWLAAKHWDDGAWVDRPFTVAIGV